MTIRLTSPDDITALQDVLRKIELFPAEMLPDLLAQDEEAVWLTALHGDTPMGFAYAAPEEMTDGTWNMRALGVHPTAQRNGLARALCSALEKQLHTHAVRLLIVDTSGTAEYSAARAF